MKKKIVVITGSPRKRGNSFAMTDAFISAAEAKGHEVVRFDAAMMQVGGCRACDTCFKNGKPCSFDDDFNKIAPFIEAADGIVFTMPVYWYTMPAQIKAVIDRMCCFSTGGKDLSGKSCALITCCADDDMSSMDGVRFAYERSIEFLEWNSVGEVLMPSLCDVGDVANSDGCQRAAALAQAF